jgi:hypothetical protein
MSARLGGGSFPWRTKTRLIPHFPLRRLLTCVRPAEIIPDCIVQRLPKLCLDLL